MVKANHSLLNSKFLLQSCYFLLCGVETCDSISGFTASIFPWQCMPLMLLWYKTYKASQLVSQLLVNQEVETTLFCLICQNSSPEVLTFDPENPEPCEYTTLQVCFFIVCCIMLVCKHHYVVFCMCLLKVLFGRNLLGISSTIGRV